MPVHNIRSAPRSRSLPGACRALPFDYDPSGGVGITAKAYADLPAKLPEITEEPYHVDRLLPRRAKPLVLSELEDWDEDDYDDYDDQDQAYTTAHSFRSRDLTTGGVTTLLGPRVTARVQRELEEAKLEVQQTRSLDDIEEEMWDVSMVAEYGEEIFEYMRELEVRCTVASHALSRGGC